VAVLSLLVGLLMVAGSASNFQASALFEVMPPVLIGLVGVLFVLGSCLALRGLHWDKDDRVSVGWRIEEGGWILITTALVSFAIGAGYVGASATGVLIPWVLGASSFLRWLSFRYIRRNAQVRHTNGRDTDG